jgi:hypothetical protein
MNTSADYERTVVGEGFERLHSVVHEWTESGRIVGAGVLGPDALRDAIYQSKI